MARAKMLAEASSNGLYLLFLLTSHRWTLRGSEAEGVQESLLRRNGGGQAGGPIPVAEYRIGQMRYLQREDSRVRVAAVDAYVDLLCQSIEACYRGLDVGGQRQLGYGLLGGQAGRQAGRQLRTC